MSIRKSLRWIPILVVVLLLGQLIFGALVTSAWCGYNHPCKSYNRTGYTMYGNKSYGKSYNTYGNAKYGKSYNMYGNNTYGHNGYAKKNYGNSYSTNGGFWFYSPYLSGSWSYNWGYGWMNSYAGSYSAMSSWWR